MSPSGAADLRACAQIDLGAIRDNTRRLSEISGSSEVLAVVKAGAYGHGLTESGRAARQGGAGWLGVALLDEALALRAAGDQGRILAWLATPGDRFDECVAGEIDLAAYDVWCIDEIASAARSANKAAKVHLKIDTGLGRSGAYTADWPDLVRAAIAAESEGLIQITGMWSHFAYADSPKHPTVAAQITNFDEAVALAKRLGAKPELLHLANSAATLALPNAHYDMVRPGIAVYGISPGPEVGTSESLGLRPAMTFSGRIALVKDAKAGEGISYGHEYVTPAPTKLALVPIGYADGVPRKATNAGPVLAAGRQRKVAGRMCMDQFVLDLEGDTAQAGDEVVLFGPGDRGEATAQDWADACGTIPYEIVTNVGPRVPRVYVDGA